MFQPLLPLERFEDQPRRIHRANETTPDRRWRALPGHAPVYPVPQTGLEGRRLPHAERIGQSTITLPLFPGMSLANVERVCTGIKRSVAPGIDWMSHRIMNTPEVSIVIPVYNLKDGLQALFDRLYPALDALKRSYEVIFINDGSKDRQPSCANSSRNVRKSHASCCLTAISGQHKAILAGFALQSRQRIITLDADLQNPPEDIANLLAK